jgi:hypothetical protein
MSAEQDAIADKNSQREMLMMATNGYTSARAITVTCTFSYKIPQLVHPKAFVSLEGGPGLSVRNVVRIVSHYLVRRNNVQ